MKKILLILVALLTYGCQDYGDLTFLAKLPKGLKENSGIEILSEEGPLWIIEDSKNKNHIYGVDLSGNIVSEFKIANAKNRDWEDIAKDGKGNLYIGDFGNNRNKRKDLCIYKIPNPLTSDSKELNAEKISFYYPEQISFPPNRRDYVYDAEAFFFFNEFLYIFTKNRMSSKLFDGRSLVYRIPARPGNHKAELINLFVSCEERLNCQISSASISPDNTKVALLSHNRVWIFSDFKDDDFIDGKVEIHDLGHSSQKEGVCFKDNETLLITDELGKKRSGRNLYEYSLKAEP